MPTNTQHGMSSKSLYIIETQPQSINISILVLLLFKRKNYNNTSTPFHCIKEICDSVQRKIHLFTSKPWRTMQLDILSSKGKEVIEVLEVVSDSSVMILARWMNKLNKIYKSHAALNFYII